MCGSQVRTPWEFTKFRDDMGTLNNITLDLMCPILSIFLQVILIPINNS